MLCPELMMGFESLVLFGTMPNCQIHWSQAKSGMPSQHARTGKVTTMNPGGWKMMRTPAIRIC